MPKGMELARKIRKSTGLSRYEMAAKMLRSWDSYNYLEQKGELVTLLDLVLLRSVSGMSVKDFWELVEEEAAAMRKKRKVKPKRKADATREAAKKRDGED